jgi:hypothetical protein
MASPPSSNFDQRLDRLEESLGSIMREMRELVDAMNSKVNRLIAPSSTSSLTVLSPQPSKPKTSIEPPKSPTQAHHIEVAPQQIISSPKISHKTQRKITSRPKPTKQTHITSQHLYHSLHRYQPQTPKHLKQPLPWFHCQPPSAKKPLHRAIQRCRLLKPRCQHCQTARAPSSSPRSQHRNPSHRPRNCRTNSSSAAASVTSSWHLCLSLNLGRVLLHALYFKNVYF